MLFLPQRRPPAGGFRRSRGGFRRAVALEVVLYVFPPKTEAVPDSDRGKITSPDDPVDAGARDAEISGELVYRQHPGRSFYFVLGMERHGSIVKGRSSQKSVRNDLSDKERLSYFDDEEAAVVPRVLADDSAFLDKAAKVASAPGSKRRAVAEQEAAAYTEYRGPARVLIAGYLLVAAEAPWRDVLVGEYSETTETAARRCWFVNLSGRSVWVEAPLEQADPRRARRREAALEEGAKRVARFGAGQCICCGMTLAERYVAVGASRRRTRRDRCGACDVKPDLYPTAMRDALEAATRQRQYRRAARRRT